jgi:TolA-binding protein
VGLGVAAVITSVALFRKPSAAPAVAPPRATASVASAAAPSAATVRAEPTTAAIPAPAPPSNAGNARTSSSRRSDALAAEVAILSRAETELHAGRFTSALDVLDEHARRFPRGTLTQERVAARVQALCGLGRVAEAKAELTQLGSGSLQAGSAREVCGVK